MARKVKDAEVPDSPPPDPNNDSDVATMMDFPFDLTRFIEEYNPAVIDALRSHFLSEVRGEDAKVLQTAPGHTLWRARLHLENFEAELEEMLTDKALGPLLRKASAVEKSMMPGNAKQWPQLRKIWAILDRIPTPVE